MLDNIIDGKFFYRGGNPNWGIIKENYNISRCLKVIDKNNYSNSQITDSYSLHARISDLTIEKGIHKVLLIGAAVSGKTTDCRYC